MSLALALIRKPLDFLPSYRSKTWWLFFALASVIALSFVSVSVYASGFGGWVSEKLVDRSGVSNSNVLIDRSGVSNSGLDVAMSGVAAVTGATGIYMDGTGTHATLNGNLSTLNGFPNVTAYFQWGYDTSYGHTTASQTLAATGAFSSSIAGFDPGKTVYYRTVIESDGTNYSSPASFDISSGSVTTTGIVAGFNLLNAVVVVAYIAMVIFVVIALGSKSTMVALLFMAIAIYLGEAFITAIQEALNRVFGG